jgi:hypothetical protein
MGADWIKVEKVTPGKPEVLGVSQILGIHPYHAFGLCVRFWLWCDDQLDSESVTGMSQKFVTNVALDFVIGHVGFTDALVQVGWLVVENGRLVVPNFDRHLSESAKKRADSRRRKQKERESGKDRVTEMSQKSVTSVARMSQECHTPSISLSLNTDSSSFDVSEAFEVFWKAYPCAQGKKEARKAFDIAIERLSKKTTAEEAAEKLTQAAADYRKYIEGVPNPPKVKYAQGWLNSDRFEDDYVEELARGLRSVPASYAQQRVTNTENALTEFING